MKHAKIKQQLDKPIGEIISTFFRESELQDLFENRGGVPAEFAGMASGDIALRMGLIDQETKTALLTAQAATRVLKLVDAAEMRVAGNPKAPALNGSFNDDIFKFIGSDRDADMLKTAQAAWQLAHIHCMVLDARKNNGDDFIVRNAPAYIAGLRKHAAACYQASATELAAKGQDRIAKQFMALADDAVKAQPATARPPRHFAADILAERNIDAARDMVSLGQKPQGQPLSFPETLLKLYRLADPLPPVQPAPKAGPSTKPPKAGI